jgi:hypothetical protein
MAKETEILIKLTPQFHLMLYDSMKVELLMEQLEFSQHQQMENIFSRSLD